MEEGGRYGCGAVSWCERRREVEKDEKKKKMKKKRQTKAGKCFIQCVYSTVSERNIQDKIFSLEYFPFVFPLQMQLQAGLKDWPAKQQHYIQHLLELLKKTQNGRHRRDRGVCAVTEQSSRSRRKRQPTFGFRPTSCQCGGMQQVAAC